MKDLMHRFWKDEAGQDVAEYAMMLALVALVLIASIQAFRGAIQAKFQASTSQLTSGVT